MGNTIRRNARKVLAVLLGLCVAWFALVDLVKVKAVSPPPGDPGRFVDVGGLRTYYQVEGRGPAVLLLHGTGASGYSWRQNVTALAERFTVYVPDIPGYGYSDKPPGEHWSRALASWASQFLRTVGVEKAAVIGHSMGGEIALWLAIDHPEQVDRLLLVDAAGVGGLTGSFRMVATPVLGEIMLKSTGEAMLRRLMRQAYARKEVVTDEMVSLYHRFTWSPGARNAFLSRLRRYEQDRVALQEQLGRVKAPTAAFWGAHDPYFGLEVGRKLVGQIPGATLTVFRTSGHVPHEEQPEGFNRLALAWLTRGETVVEE